MTDQIEEIRGFIERYRTFTDSLAGKEQEEFRSKFDRLGTELKPINEEIAAVDKACAPNFNIFRLLNPKEYEKAHSDFLAELLRPNGNHGQRDLFLTNFLELCDPKLSREPIQARHVWVEREKPTSDGFLDIVIQSTSPRFIIIIENKIKAHDQPTQLDRYSGWLERQPMCPKDGKFLVYLAAREEQRNAAEEKKDKYLNLRTLSYHRIASWLRACELKTQAPRVKDLIAQYMDVVATFNEGEEDAESN